jgi:hypothetical protein
MGVKKVAGMAAGGVATALMSRMLVGKVGTAVVVGRYLLKDPTVQKIRKRVMRKVAEASKRAK